VESYFERYCMPEGAWNFSHARKEYVGKEGIIGYRGANARGKQWYNHMPAVEIRNKIGSSIWDSYFKFTVVRNPFDKLISSFYMLENSKRKLTKFGRLRVFAKKLLGKATLVDRIAGDSEIDRFRSWMRAGGAIIDRDKYLINGDICVDFFIRFEDLENGIKDVCNKLGIAFEPNRIPYLKSGIRSQEFSLNEFYDPETIDIVNKLYEFELNYFGYSVPSVKNS
jgi:hypothetical protein